MPTGDIYRDPPVRYLGYANEIGESFRFFIGSRGVQLTYGVATLYVVADTIDKTLKVSKENKPAKTLFVAGDTLLWQMLASVIIPGFTINRICWGTNWLLGRTAVPKDTRRWLVAAVGLACIPIIIKPIDNLVDEVMDATIRKWFKPS